MGITEDARNLNMAAAFAEQAAAARRARHREDAAMVQTEADRAAAAVLGDEQRAIAPTTFHHHMAMERRIQHGAPKFNHVAHLFFTLLSGGFWSIGWAIMWFQSPRRRYLKWRRAQLRQAGLYHR